jgi:hypothetical protein
MGDDDYREELLYLAVRMAALANWADDALAGGAPTKYIALQLVAGIYYIRALTLQAMG